LSTFVFVLPRISRLQTPSISFTVYLSWFPLLSECQWTRTGEAWLMFCVFVFFSPGQSSACLDDEFYFQFLLFYFSLGRWGWADRGLIAQLAPFPCTRLLNAFLSLTRRTTTMNESLMEILDFVIQGRATKVQCLSPWTLPMNRISTKVFRFSTNKLL
jgi:hypothetical protein